MQLGSLYFGPTEMKSRILLVLQKIIWSIGLLLITGGGEGGCDQVVSDPARNPAAHFQSNVQRRLLPDRMSGRSGRDGGGSPDPNTPPLSAKLTLEQAVQEALTASPELAQIQARINAANELVRQAESTFYPRIVLAEDFSATNNPVYAMMDIINQRRFRPDINFNNPGQQQNLSTQFQGQWSLFEGGSRLYNRSATIHEREVMEANLSAARNQMVATVTQTYYQWLQALSFIEVAQQALVSAQTDEKLGQARLESEMALNSEVLRFRTATAEAEGRLVAARTSAQRLQAAMERLLARRMNSDETPETMPDLQAADLETLTYDPNLLIERALDHRPEIAAVAAMIRAADDRVRAAKGEMFPRVAAHAWYGWDSEEISGAQDSWMVGIAATWPLFEGGVTRSRIREAKSAVREMMQRGEQVALDIALEVQQAGLAVQEAAEKIRVAVQQRDLARQSLEEVRQQYEQQVVSVEALLQVEVAWNRAEVGYTTALFEGLIAQAQLRRALGDFVNWMEIPPL